MYSASQKAKLLKYRFNGLKGLPLSKLDRSLQSYEGEESSSLFHIDSVNHDFSSARGKVYNIPARESEIFITGWVAFSSSLSKSDLELFVIIDQYALRVSDFSNRADVIKSLKSSDKQALGFSALIPRSFLDDGINASKVLAISTKTKKPIASVEFSLNKVPPSSPEDHQIIRLEETANNLYLSLSWRITQPLRKTLDIIAKTLIKSGNKPSSSHYNRLLKQHKETLQMVQNAFSMRRNAAQESTNYKKWLANKSTKTHYRHTLNPLISIIIPVYNVDPQWLNLCIESVLNQTYAHFEVCVYDDCSTSQETIDTLNRWKSRNEKVKVQFGKKNQHISLASNEAIKMAEGEFIGLLDNDDELTHHALDMMVAKLNDKPDADFIFSDEDKKEMNGERTGAYFKPGYNKYLFSSNNYLCHFSLIRKSIGDKVGWFRKGYEGSQDFDLFLRISSITDKIAHVPDVLYHWRKIPGSTATEYSTKHYANDASIKALNDHLTRLNLNGEVVNGLWPGSFRIKYGINNSPKVSIIIPFKDQVELLKACVHSILEKTKYSNYEIILVNNQSALPETQQWLTQIKQQEKINILEYKKPFNFSSINNYAVEQCDGKFVVFLNNDTEVIAHDWLSAMLELAQQEDVGAVGAKLLYRDCTVQHAGVILGVGGVATHAFHGFNEDDNFYFGNLNVIREYAAVSAACMMVERKKFNQVNGMDESLPVAYNDVDLCLSFRKKGLVNVYTPFAKLFHYESKTRGYDTKGEKKARLMKDQKYLYDKWGAEILENDPYLNENLNTKKPNFMVAVNE